MSDIDRLRAAADALDEGTRWYGLTQKPQQIDLSDPVAALLRAVADLSLITQSAGVVRERADALADTILGPQSVPDNTSSSYLPDSSHSTNATTRTEPLVSDSHTKGYWISCWNHCGCPPGQRTGHDDTCRFGCNDEEVGLNA